MLLKGSLALSFDSTAVLEMSGVALITMLIHAEMVTPTDVRQFLNLTSATRNCTRVISTEVLNADLDSAERNDTSLIDPEHNPADRNNSTQATTAVPGDTPNVSSDFTEASDSNAFWSDVLSFLWDMWGVVVDILHQLAQILLHPQPSAEFVLVALTTLLCTLLLFWLSWNCIHNFYRFMKWLCCLCHSPSSDDSLPPAPEQPAHPQQLLEPDIELAALDHAFLHIDQEPPIFDMELQVDAAVDQDPPAPLAIPEDFHYIPAPPPPPPPPSSPAQSVKTTAL